MEGLREIHLDDKDWGEILLLLPIPRSGDPWGVLAPLKETPWGKLVVEVTGEAMSEALHGYAVPLMRQLGRAPRDQAKRLLLADRQCSLLEKGTCGLEGPHCEPSSGELPFCYEAPALGGEQKRAANRIAAAWNEGRYVIVVVGKGFNLR